MYLESSRAFCAGPKWPTAQSSSHALSCRPAPLIQAPRVAWVDLAQRQVGGSRAVARSLRSSPREKTGAPAVRPAPVVLPATPWRRQRGVCVCGVCVVVVGGGGCRAEHRVPLGCRSRHAPAPLRCFCLLASSFFYDFTQCDGIGNKDIQPARHPRTVPFRACEEAHVNTHTRSGGSARTPHRRAPRRGGVFHKHLKCRTSTARA